MNRREINAMIALRDETVAGIAAAIGENSSSVTHTINYLRRNDHIRKKLAEYFNMPVEKLFDESIEVAPARYRGLIAKAS